MIEGIWEPGGSVDTQNSVPLILKGCIVSQDYQDIYLHRL